jgi:hypothetical protein
MGKLNVQFPRFIDVYDGRLMRAFVRQLELVLSRVEVIDFLPPYEITTNKTLGGTDSTVLANTSAGSITVTLPKISDAMIKNHTEFVIVKTAAANTLTVQPTSGDTIRGAASISTTTQWSSYRLLATTGNWVTI